MREECEIERVRAAEREREKERGRKRKRERERPTGAPPELHSLPALFRYTLDKEWVTTVTLLNNSRKGERSQREGETVRWSQRERE